MTKISRFFVLTISLQLLLVSGMCEAGIPPTQWTEEDGSPARFQPRQSKFPNGSITDNGDNTISISFSGGIGGSLDDCEVVFSDGSTLLGDQANFCWDDTNDILLLGGTTAGTADNVLYADGRAIFNQQQNDSDFIVASTGESSLIVTDAANDTAGIVASNTTAQFAITPHSAGLTTLKVFSRSGSTANTQEWHNPSGISVSQIQDDGTAIFPVVGVNQSSPSAQVDIVNAAATDTALEINAASAQSADIVNITSNGGSAGDLVTVENDGDVTIGGASASSTSRQFRITHDEQLTESIGVEKVGDWATGDTITFLRARGTVASPAVLQDNDSIGSLLWEWWNTSLSDYTIGAAIQARIVNSPDDTKLQFLTQGSAGLAEEMTIMDEGEIGMGDPSPDVPLEILNTSSPQFRLSHTDNVDDVDFGVDASGDFDINISGDNFVIQNDTDGTSGFQILDADGGTSIVNVDTTNEYVGFGTDDPVTQLHVNDEVTDDNSFSYDPDAIMVVHQTATSTTTLNDPQDVLYLARQGTAGQAYGAMATFKLSRYENSGVNSRTRLDLDLAHASFDEVNVATFLSSGNVGLSDNNPDATLEIVDLGGDIINLSSAAGNDGDYMTMDTSGDTSFGVNSPGGKRFTIRLKDANNDGLLLQDSDGDTIMELITQGPTTGSRYGSLGLYDSTATPVRTVHLNAETDSWINPGLRVGSATDGTMIGVGSLEIYDVSGGSNLNIVTSNDASIARGGILLYTSEGTLRSGIRSGVFKADNDLEFFTGNHSHQMTLTSTGELGLNESSPDAMIEIVTNATTQEGLHTKASASQSADLLRVTNSSDVDIFTVGPTGIVEVSNTTTTGILKLDGGSDSTGSDNLIQIAFGFGGTATFPHFIQTRHNGGTAVRNAIDFYTGDGTSAGVYPTNAIHGLTITNGSVGIGVTEPDTALEILNATAPQLRLTHTDGIDDVDFSIDANGDFDINISGDNFVIRNDTDGVNGFQVLDADGGTPILNIDTTNERIGFKVATPLAPVHISGNVALQGASDIIFSENPASTLDYNVDWEGADDIARHRTQPGSSQNIDYGLFTFAIDYDNDSVEAANQEVFEIGKNGADDSEVTYTELFALDEDGDGTFAGGLTLGTALTVANGGTGATTLTDGGLLLGSGTGAITALGVAANGQIPIGDGTTDPVLATLTGTANEVDISNGAGSITIGIVDPLIVSKGGTGASSLTDGGILLGSGTGAVTALGVATNGQIPIGDGTTDPVLATITGDDGIAITNGAGTIEIDVDPLTAGADADSITTSADGGLEIISNKLSIIRGCSDGEGLTWNETSDTWACGSVGGGSSEWTDGGSFLHPTDTGGTADDVIVGDNTVATADHIFQAGGGVILNEQGTGDARIESANETHMIFVDSSEDEVCIGCSVATSPFDVDEGTSYAIREESAGMDITANETERTILCDTSTAAFTINLPAASGVTGRVYIFKVTDASGNGVTIDPNSTEQIDGSTTVTLSTQYEGIRIQSDGTQWWKIGSF